MRGAPARLDEPFLRRPLHGSRLYTHAEHLQLHSHILLLRGIEARICKHVMLQASPSRRALHPRPVLQAQVAQIRACSSITPLLTLLHHVLVTGQTKDNRACVREAQFG